MFQKKGEQKGRSPAKSVQEREEDEKAREVELGLVLYLFLHSGKDDTKDSARTGL